MMCSHHFYPIPKLFHDHRVRPQSKTFFMPSKQLLLYTCLPSRSLAANLNHLYRFTYSCKRNRTYDFLHLAFFHLAQCFQSSFMLNHYFTLFMYVCVCAGGQLRRPGSVHFLIGEGCGIGECTTRR